MKVFKAYKDKKLQEWFYYFKNGHEQLFKEEADIICEFRLDPFYISVREHLIRKLIETHINLMYRKKFPSAKRWSFSNF